MRLTLINRRVYVLTFVNKPVNLSHAPSSPLHLYGMFVIPLPISNTFPLPSSSSSVPFLLVTSVQSDYSHKMTHPASLCLILKCMLGVSHISLPAGLVTVISWDPQERFYKCDLSERRRWQCSTLDRRPLTPIRKTHNCWHKRFLLFTSIMPSSYNWTAATNLSILNSHFVRVATRTSS